MNLGTKLCAFILAVACTVAAQPTGDEIILWQYIEGSHYNKGVAVYNRGKVDVDLGKYKYSIWIAHNGKQLKDSLKADFKSGIIVPVGGYAMICDEQADGGLQAFCNMTVPSITMMNKDDVVSLMKDQTQYDVIGDFNTPGPWAVAGVSAATQDRTLVRDLTSVKATIVWSEAATQYKVLDKDVFQTLDGDIINIAGGGSSSPGGSSPGGSSESCVGNCGVYHSSDKCYCNTQCTKYNDCCDDYQSVCVDSGSTSASCENRCGEKSSDGSCWCDDDCSNHHNCCDDYDEYCHGTSTHTCEGYCGSHTPDYSCWCNDQCNDHNDCCDDYNKVCGGPPSPPKAPNQCGGACYGSSSDGSCYCNSQCQSKGDCCSDYNPTACSSSGSPPGACGDPCECPTAPPEDQLKNNMLKKDVLSIGTYNAEWLFDGINGPKQYSPWQQGGSCPSGNANPTLPCTPAGAMQHIKDVAAEIDKLDVDILNIVEVESCEVMQYVASNIPGKNYSTYLKQGKDTATMQNVGLLTLIDPIIDLQRTESRQTYPLGFSTCGYEGPSDTGVSKHYFTVFKIGDVVITWIGVHFISNPTSTSKCAKREAQAMIIRGLIKDALDQGHEVIVLGDMNDWTSEPSDIDSVNSQPISKVLPKVLQDVDDDNKLDLFSAAGKVPKSERYTEAYQDSATMLDHILMTPTLYNLIDSVVIDHTIKKYQISDHWPVIVRFKLQPPLIAVPQPPTPAKYVEDIILWELVRANNGDIGIAIVNVGQQIADFTAADYSLVATTSGMGWDSAEHIDINVDVQIPPEQYFMVCNYHASAAFLEFCNTTHNFTTLTDGSIVIGLKDNDVVIDAIGDVSNPGPWSVNSVKNAGGDHTVVRDLTNAIPSTQWGFAATQYSLHPTNTFVSTNGVEMSITPQTTSGKKSSSNAGVIVLCVIAAITILLALMVLFGTPNGRTFIRKNIMGQKGKSMSEDDRLMQMESMGEMPMFSDDAKQKKVVY